MNAKQLIKMLKEVPPDMDVFIATDEEGNGYGMIDNGYCVHKYEDVKGERRICALYPCGYISPDDVTDE